MSIQSDEYVFEASITENQEVPLFNSKSWTYITDTTNGSFTGGAINFDLSTFSSQQDFAALKEAYIDFPVKITAELSRAASGTTVDSQIGQMGATLKGSIHMINSAQLVINGTTYQSPQNGENIAATFKVLSSYSQDALNKDGSTYGIFLDDMTGDTMSNITSTNDTNELIISADGLNGAIYSTVASTVKGLDLCSESAHNKVLNKGLVKRFKTYNTPAVSTNIACTILGTELQNQGLSNVVVSGDSNTPGAKLFSLCTMCHVKLKHIIDLEQFPLTRNLKGYLYININGFQVDLTGSVAEGVISNVQYTALNGATTNPLLIVDSGTGTFQNGTSIGAGSTQTPIIRYTVNVDGQADGFSKPISRSAFLYVPMYSPNPPAIERLLNTNYNFSSYEKIITPIDCPAGQPINRIITVGVPNVKHLVLIPLLKNLGDVSNLDNPEYSAFYPSPNCTEPYAHLRALQVQVANKNLFLNPIDYSYQQFIFENRELGLNGANDSELTSGLLNEQLFTQNHRFYSFNLARRMGASDDGASKAVQVQFTNATNFNMKVIAILFYEKKWSFNTSQCLLTQA